MTKTLNSNTVLKTLVLGGVATILVLSHGQTAKAQPATITKADPVLANAPLSRPVVLPAQQNCRIYAALPQQNQGVNNIVGAGTRGEVCLSPANMTVKLKQDRRFWFDRTLATKEGGGTNFELFVKYTCKGTGGQIVYTQVESGKKKVQSQRVSIFFCG